MPPASPPWTGSPALRAAADDDRAGDALVEAARRDERIRLADRLHDDALQRLSALRQDLVELHDDLCSERVDAAAQALDGAVAALRSVVRATHDEALSALPLPVALGHVVTDAAHRAGLEPRLVVGDVVVAADDAAFVLAVVRELSANVATHARATELSVVVAEQDGGLRIAVADDGVGTTSEQVARRAHEGHLGLAMLRRRAVDRGGSFSLSSDAVTGTTVVVTVPTSGERLLR